MIKFFIYLLNLIEPLTLLVCSTIYLALILISKRLNILNNPDASGSIKPNKLFESNIIEKFNIILHRCLIGLHLVLLVSLLFVSTVYSLDTSYLSLTGNESMLNLNLNNSYQTLIIGEKQVDLFKRFCESKHQGSVCELNGQISRGPNHVLTCRCAQRKTNKNDLKESDLRDETDLNDRKQCKGHFYSRDFFTKNDQMSDKHLVDNRGSIGDLAELNRLLFIQIASTLLAIVAILLSLLHYADTLVKLIIEFKLNRNYSVNYLELQSLELDNTHIVERVLTPFYIYFDFKYFNSSTSLWFTIAWSLLHIVIRTRYFTRSTNEKLFKYRPLLADTLQIKVIFYSSFLLLSNYMMVTTQSEQILPNSIKIFNLVYSLILFLVSLSDWETATIAISAIRSQASLDSNNNLLSSSNRNSKSNWSNFNKDNEFIDNSTPLQPVCAHINRRI